MPGLNRKGPQGKGPGTGRKMGRCNPDNKGKTDEEILQKRSSHQTGKNQASGSGRGGRSGKGMGMGRRRGSYFSENE